MIFTGRMRRGVAVACAALLAGASCGKPPAGKPARRAAKKVFVLGFDGMDPTLSKQYMDEGKLPHLKKLAEGGTFRKLETTQPSESPVAWSSFATGVNPGKHNIYDFLVRDFETYLPDLAGVKRFPPKFLWGFLPTGRPRLESTRGGKSFWLHAGADGIKSVVLTVPMTFPPEEIPHGSMLGGLPLPDVRGTIGFFSYWATDLSSFEEGNTEFGGFLKRLIFEKGVAKTLLKGPDSPILKQEENELREQQKQGRLSDKQQARLEQLATSKEVNLDLSVRWKEGDGRAEIEIQGRKLALKTGEWSEWVPVTFSFNVLVKVHGMVQFHLIRADKELQLYASPVNLDPRNPPVPISKPDDFSAKLVQQIGLYRTIGWAEATW